MACGLLTACATGPAFVAAESPSALAAANEAVVYLYRPRTLYGAAIRREVVFDGKPAGRLLIGSHMRLVFRGDGAYAELRVAGCSRITEAMVLRPGDVLYVEAQTIPSMLQMGGRAYFDHVCRLRLRDGAEALPSITGLPLSD